MQQPQDIRRCALALLLPLFIRSTNAVELCISVFSVVVATPMAVWIDGKPFNRELVSTYLPTS